MDAVPVRGKPRERTCRRTCRGTFRVEGVDSWSMKGAVAQGQNVRQFDRKLFLGIECSL